MAKKRSLKDDAVALKDKTRTLSKDSENPEGDARIRALKKRLKRAQRKLRTIKRRAEGPKRKKSGSET